MTRWSVVRSVPRVAALVACAVLTVVTAHRVSAPLPDLLLPVVVAAALAAGATRGALWGLAAGWVVDLVPPGSTVLGTSALLYAACGLLAGLGRREGVTPWGWVALVGAGSALVATLGRVALAVGAHAPVDLRDTGLRLLTTVVWCAVSVPVLVWLERTWRRP